MDVKHKLHIHQPSTNTCKSFVPVNGIKS